MMLAYELDGFRLPLGVGKSQTLKIGYIRDVAGGNLFARRAITPERDKRGGGK